MRLPLSLFTLCLAGCNLAPRYEAPAPPIYSEYPGQHAGVGQPATAVKWQEFFGDPLLKTYIATALANNRDLAAASAFVAQAEAQFRIQRAAQLPQVDLAASGGKAKTPVRAANGDVSSVTAESYVAQLSVSAFELDFWGRVRNLSESARRQYLATVEGERAFRLSMIANVASLYYAIRAGEAGIALSERTLASRVEALEIAKLRLDAGVTSAVDFEQSAVLVTQARTQLAELQRTTEQLRNQLLVVIGGPTTTELPTGRPIEDPGQFTAIDAGLPSQLLINRPDVLRAEQQLRAANADIGVARALFFPTIALTGAAGYVSNDLDNLFESSSEQWSYGAAALLPIFDFGRRRALLQQSKARQAELVAVYQRTVQQAFREVCDGLVGRQRLEEQVRAQEEAVAVMQRLAEIAELRYDNGVSLYLEVLDAERNLFSAQQQLLQLRAAELQNGVSLYTALGGGTE
ncbi:MAG TPA: efflux transporter outer membrane subunit [Povalibacter sp.]|nr:efflux transporter outer membrane subunit [Povalibacter sp.]